MSSGGHLRDSLLSIYRCACACGCLGIAGVRRPRAAPAGRTDGRRGGPGARRRLARDRRPPPRKPVCVASAGQIAGRWVATENRREMFGSADADSAPFFSVRPFFSPASDGERLVLLFRPSTKSGVNGPGEVEGTIGMNAVLTAEIRRLEECLLSLARLVESKARAPPEPRQE